MVKRRGVPADSTHVEALASAPPVAIAGRMRRFLRPFLDMLPRGQTLPYEEWQRRNHLLLAWVWLQVPALLVYTLLEGYNWVHTFFHVGTIITVATAASLPMQSRRTKSILVSLGLLTGAALAVHAAHGLIEMHFYFFVVIVALTLYEDWVPFLMAVAYVAIHHGIFGALDRSAVYDHPGSPWMWAGIHAVFVLAAGGVAIVAWRLNEDLRDRQRLAEEKRLEAQAESGRLKSEFFALVSHELRTPLTSITGYLDILAEAGVESLTDMGQRSIEVIGRNTERLQRLVEDLLLLTQVDAGTFHVESSPTHLEQIANDTIEAMTPRAEAGHVTLHAEVDQLPPITGDGSRLAQVLDNLISNAIKFTPPGGRIDLRVKRAGEEVAIEIEDTGTGISAHELEHVFDRFFRAAEAMTKQIQGVGLGLAITKVIVEAHGGTISLESEEGKWTLVRIVLPIGAATASLPHRGHAPAPVFAAG
jgi:signal transduction histidine kinase